MPDGCISFEEFDAACSIAREFNEYVRPERVRGAAFASSDAKGDRPGDEFNRRASWADILEPHGWVVAHTAGDVTYWRRPGKGRDHSATTGKCSSDLGGDLLYVFTSSAAPFEMEAAYSKFSAYAVLNHGGDFVAASKKLRDDGYGKANPTIQFGTAPPGGDPADDGVPPDFDFATNADLKRLDLGTKWVWEKWLQVGAVNLLAAEGGMGKTRFVADLCRRVHQGLPWPDGTAAPPWDSQYLAMWVAGDRNQGELLTLSEAFGFGDRICYSGTKADPLGGITLNSSADFQALYRKVKAARPMFLVIDTAGGTTSFDMAKQGEARAFFSPLSDIAVRMGLCVIVITHLNASKNVLGKRAEERVRVVMRLSAADRVQTTPRRLEIVKSNSLMPPPLGMTLGESGNEYSDDAPPAPEAGGFGAAGGGDNGDPERGPSTKARECADWLQEVLAEKPRRVSDLRNECENRGWSAKVMYKAKGVAGVFESEDAQGYKWWALKSD